MMEPRLIEVKDIIRKAQAESAPGPGLGGIPYQVYKNCPRLPTRLCKLLRVVWKKERGGGLEVSRGMIHPKGGIHTNLTASLLNVEGNIFFAIVGRTNFMLDNKYRDTSVQKGGILGI